MSFSDVRRAVYKYHQDYYDYIFKWPWYSYRKYKAVLYMELASVMAYIFLSLSVPPNTITVLYIISSVMTGILLSMPFRSTAIIASGLLFIKQTLDWSDGAVARITGKSSRAGDLLDNYGAVVAWVFMWAGLGIYLGNSTSHLFYFLAPVIPMLLASDIYANVRERLVYHYLKKEKSGDPEVNTAQTSSAGQLSRVKKIKNFVDSIFEQNTRTIDIITACILIESLCRFRITWIIYTAFLLWQIFLFFLKLYMVSNRGWGDDELDRLRKVISE